MNTPILDDGDVQLYHGDAIQTLRALPAGIAQTCITSPPYWGLRDYGTGEWTGGDTACDHVAGKARQDNGQRTWDGGTVQSGPLYFGAECGRCGARRTDSQLGLEASPDLYVERLVAVFREVWRVLRVDGTVWINLGDSYASSDGLGRNDAGRNFTGGGGNIEGSGNPGRQGTFKLDSGLKPKDLVGIPWRVAFALQADGWYLRSDIIWSKPNPMPESVSDRPTKAHEYLFLLAKQPRYFYDADAIREPPSPSTIERFGDKAYEWMGPMERRRWEASPTDKRRTTERGAVNAGMPEGGRNRRSVWTIPTQPFPLAHFATFPEALVRPCVLAGTSEHGECRVCGSPWMRVVERAQPPAVAPSGIDRYGNGDAGVHRKVGGQYQKWLDANPPETTGWHVSCECSLGATGAGNASPAPTIPQMVLDPFIGSGTTALVARNHGRRCIGIDLSSEYLAIAARRLQQLSLLSEPTA